MTAAVFGHIALKDPYKVGYPFRELDNAIYTRNYSRGDYEYMVQIIDKDQHIGLKSNNLSTDRLDLP